MLTPLAIDPGHPFPHLHNKSLNMPADRDDQGGQLPELFAVVQVPSVLDRVVLLPGSPEQVRFVLLEDVIAPRLDTLFGGFRVAGHTVFRVTRNSDLTIQKTRRRTCSRPSRRPSGCACGAPRCGWRSPTAADEGFVQMLVGALDLERPRRLQGARPGRPDRPLALHRLEGFPRPKEAPFEPQMPPAFAPAADVFAPIREQDILVHHPYESFGSVVQFIEQAADDPQVLAIKQTLYRTADDNPIISALARAAENGKQVTALVELQARLDEENNIVKARALEKAGRPRRLRHGRPEDPLQGGPGRPPRARRHPALRPPRHRQLQPDHRADLHRPGLFTAAGVRRGRQRPVQPPDRLLAGAALAEASSSPRWTCAERIVELIDREARNAEAGLPARIIAKMNALVDPARHRGAVPGLAGRASGST